MEKNGACECPKCGSLNITIKDGVIICKEENCRENTQAG